MEITLLAIEKSRIGVLKFVGILNMTIRGPVAQSVASLTADPGVASLIPDQSHTFMEIDCEMSSTVIGFLALIQDRLL